MKFELMLNYFRHRNVGQFVFGSANPSLVEDGFVLGSSRKCGQSLSHYNNNLPGRISVSIYARKAV